ncbi:MAG: hypothetical protein JEZ09_13235 [Salinivirgaceae bacterium]|nr:hypothetical protein [Salinivirgaceae bacterium]
MKIKTILSLVILFFSLALNSQTLDSTIDEKQLFIKAHSFAANEFNDSLLIEYIHLFPEGMYIEKALNSLDICAWQNACYKNTLEAYQEYINKFPKGKAVTLAAKKIKTIKETLPVEKK